MDPTDMQMTNIHFQESLKLKEVFLLNIEASQKKIL